MVQKVTRIARLLRDGCRPPTVGNLKPESGFLSILRAQNR
jgi:hypothetical protein